ncbi:MAG: IS200/IS605 family transposase [Planctomycetota bacterium]
MSDTFTQVFLHIVFSTKNREPELVGDVRETAHRYIATVARNLGCTVHALNGWTDHVHLLVEVPATIALADLVRDLKANSSRTIREDHRRPGFAWQAGYSAFSVSRRNVAAARQYVEEQERHHGGSRKLAFDAELEWLEGGS